MQTGPRSRAHAVVLAIVAWLVLYGLALAGVRGCLLLEVSRWWAAPVWVATYAVPAGLLVYRRALRWYWAGIAVAVCGTAFWLVHAGLVSAPWHLPLRLLPNGAYALAGAWIAGRLAARHGAVSAPPA